MDRDGLGLSGTSSFCCVTAVVFIWEAHGSAAGGAKAGRWRLVAAWPAGCSRLGLTSPFELPPKKSKAVAPQWAASCSCLCWYHWGSAVLGDFEAAEAPVLTLFLIGTSFRFCWIFFKCFFFFLAAKRKPQICFREVAGFAVSLVLTPAVSQVPQSRTGGRWHPMSLSLFPGCPRVGGWVVAAQPKTCSLASIPDSWRCRCVLSQPTLHHGAVQMVVC